MFPFSDKKNSITLTCTHVMIDEMPILYASHDADGIWQFLCGQEDDENDALVLELIQLYERDKTIAGVSHMPRGFFAIRETVKSEWQIYKDIFD